MKVFQLFDNPYSDRVNPYVSTIIDRISKMYHDVIFGYGKDLFWSDHIYEFDIIHIHWPDTFFNNSSTKDDTDKYIRRLSSLKEKGIEILVTCHNLEPHYYVNPYRKDVYNYTYHIASYFIHLGEWSKTIMESKYQQAEHFVIPHHTYDALYHIVEKKECIKRLRLNVKKKYIVCFGAFRNNEEREIVDIIRKEYYSKDVEILAPHYYKIQKRRNFVIIIRQWIQCRIKELLNPGLHIFGWHVSNEMLPYFYGAADISLIQRKKILNSGNLPMGLLMGKVVVGPNVGNVGLILKDTGNPAFLPDDIKSLFNAVNQAITLSEMGKGEENRLYANKHFSTMVVSEKIYNLYKYICTKNG